MLNSLEEAGEKVDILVRETFDNGEFSNYLDTLARMPNVSYGNCLLLKSQLEDVSNALPKEVWERYGKQVKETAEPLQIIKYIKNGETADYVLADVYDISQTNSNKREKSYNQELVKSVINNIQKKYDDKYKIKYEEKEHIEDSIRQIIFNMNDFQGSENTVDFVESIRFIVEPTIYTVEKHFGIETTNNNDIKNICLWGVDQDNDTLKNGLKNIQRTVNSFIKEFEREQKKYLININYKNQEQEV